MDSSNNIDSLSSSQHSSDSVLDLAQLQAAYDIEFFSILANLIWTEGKEGWPLESFEVEEHFLQKAHSFASKVSSEFYLCAAAEIKILSNKQGDFRDFKVCVANNSVRGQILCLRKLLDNHFRVNISEYHYHHHYNSNLLEGIVKQLLLRNQYSIETLCTIWTLWKNHIDLVLISLHEAGDTSELRSLSAIAYQAGDCSEHLKFAVNYLGVRKVNDTWFLLCPKFSWMKQGAADFLTEHGTWLFSIDFNALITFATACWESELASVGNRVLKILTMFYDRDDDDDEMPKAHRFSTFLHIFKLATSLNKNAGQTLWGLLRAAYLEQISPLGWNAKMNKDIVILRKSQACAGMVKLFIYHELECEDDLNYGRLTNLLVMMFGTPKLNEGTVYQLMSLRLDLENPWQSVFQRLMGESETGESEELNQFMLFYGAIEKTITLSRIQTDMNDISPTSLLYLIDRVLLWTSLVKDGVIYATKSTMTEWLIHHEEDSIKTLNCRTHQTNLVRMHEYLGNLLLELSRQDPNWTDQWTSTHDDGISTEIFVERIVMAACMLHLSSRNHFWLLEAMLSTVNVSNYLPADIWSELWKGWNNNHIGLQVVARILQHIENPLVIATLSPSSLDIVCLAEAKNEIKVSVNPDSFWDWLDSLVKDPNKVLDNSIMESFLKPCILLVNTSLQNPLSLESQDEMFELEIFRNGMMELLGAMSISSNDLIKLSKRILSRKSKVAHILNQLVRMCQRDPVAEWEAQCSSVAAASSQ